jgi:serine/threonine protein kinase
MTEIKKSDPSLVYELLEQVGKGCIGIVHRARNKLTNQEVAIKIIDTTAHEGGINDIIREVNILINCNHENIVRYYESFIKGDDLWIVMEFCGAGSVADLCELVQQPLNENQIKYVIKETLKGLEYLHSTKKLHRDIKGGNILLTTDGKVKLVDFSVSAQLNTTLQKRDTIIGTPYWMAPEVILQNHYDYRADIWSLGITAIELAEMLPPLSSVHPMRALFLIPNSPPPTLKEPQLWSQEFHDFVRQCLVKNPEERPTAKKLLQHVWVKDAPTPACIKPLIDLANSIIEKRGYRYAPVNNESASSVAESGSEVDDVVFEKRSEEDSDSDSDTNSEYRSDTLKINSTPKIQRKVSTPNASESLLLQQHQKMTTPNERGVSAPSSDQNELSMKKSVTMRSLGYSTIKKKKWLVPSDDEKTVVRFVVRCYTHFGQHVLIIGRCTFCCIL